MLCTQVLFFEKKCQKICVYEKKVVLLHRISEYDWSTPNGLSLGSEISEYLIIKFGNEEPIAVCVAAMILFSNHP